MDGPPRVSGRPSGFVIRVTGVGEELPSLIDANGEIIFEELRKIVSCVGCLPLKPKEEPEFVVYVNEEGAIDGSLQNEMATVVLNYIGYNTRACADRTVYGDVVLFSKENAGLKPDQVEELHYMCRWFAMRDEPPFDHDFTRDPNSTEEGPSSEDEEVPRTAARAMKKRLEEEDPKNKKK